VIFNLQGNLCFSDIETQGNLINLIKIARFQSIEKSANIVILKRINNIGRVFSISQIGTFQLQVVQSIVAN